MRVAPDEGVPAQRLATAFRDAAKQAGIAVSLRVTPQDKFYAEMEGKVPLNVDNFFGRTTTDTAEQAKLYGRFQEIIAEDGPGCVVYVKNFACGVSKKVSGFSPSPLFLVDISTATVAA